MFFAGKRLDEINPQLIEKFKSKEFEKISVRGTKQSPASVNRKLELLSRILSMAVDFGMIHSTPVSAFASFGSIIAESVIYRLRKRAD
jgi:hypothetical protein